MPTRQGLEASLSNVGESVRNVNLEQSRVLGVAHLDPQLSTNPPKPGEGLPAPRSLEALSLT